jgi:vacuolar iron transporter family protein
MTQNSHFEGNSPLEHLKSARLKGVKACAEHPGLDIPEYLVAMFDAIRDLCLINYLLYLILMHSVLLPITIHQTLLFFSIGFIIFKIGRETHKAYSKLERLEHLMNQERHEIKYNQEEERRELTEMYEAKGFTGKLLEQVIDTLMADDNKLLNVMLEEEMGLKLYSIDHPLKTTLSTLLGSCVGATALILSAFYFGFTGIILCTYIIVAISSAFVAHLHNNSLLQATVWNLAVLFLATTSTLFFIRFILSL